MAFLFELELWYVWLEHSYFAPAMNEESNRADPEKQHEYDDETFFWSDDNLTSCRTERREYHKSFKRWVLELDVYIVEMFQSLKIQSLYDMSSGDSSINLRLEVPVLTFHACFPFCVHFAFEINVAPSHRHKWNESLKSSRVWSGASSNEILRINSVWVGFSILKYKLFFVIMMRFISNFLSLSHLYVFVSGWKIADDTSFEKFITLLGCCRVMETVSLLTGES